MRNLKIAVVAGFLLVAVGTAQAQQYYNDSSDYQSYHAQQYQPSPQYINPMMRPVDPRSFEIKLLPPIQPLNPQGSSGVIIGPDGQASYWYVR